MPKSISDTKTVLITGGTAGIGYQTAQQLEAAGAAVLLHARDREDGDEAIERLVKAGADPLRLRLVVADFTNLREVIGLADELAATQPRLDVLVNNAAMAGPERRTLTEDGHEATFQVNYLAPYLLARTLTGAIAKASSRVVNVSSTLHRGGNIAWTDLTRTRHYSPLAAYAQSKLALTMFTRSLAGSAGEPLTAVSVHPGVADTGLLRVYGTSGSPASDAATIVTALCAANTPAVNGGYYDQLNPATPAPLVDNANARQRLAKLSARLTGQLATVD